MRQWNLSPGCASGCFATRPAGGSTPLTVFCGQAMDTRYTVCSLPNPHQTLRQVKELGQTRRRSAARRRVGSIEMWGAFLSPKRLRRATNHRGTRPFEARRMGLRPSRLPSHAGSAHPGKGQTIRRETVRRIQARSIRAGRRALIIAIWAGQPPILAWYSETADSNCWRPCLVSPRSPPNTYSISARKVEAWPASSSISAISAFRESVACRRPESYSSPGTGTGRRDLEWMSSSVVRAPSRAELTWSSFSLALVRPGRTRSSSASPTPLRIKRNGHRRGRTRARPPAPAPGRPAIR